MSRENDNVRKPGPVRRSTTEGYNRWAATYDDAGNPMVGLDSRNLPPLIGDVAGLNVADLGCGTGRNAIWMAQAGAQVTGENGGDKLVHGSGGISQPRAE